MESLRTAPITKFEGEHFFLSNFYVADFSWRGEIYPSVEHAFQAAKGLYRNDGDASTPDLYIRQADTPGQAKRMGRRIPIDVAQWEGRKVWLMREIVHAKFSQCVGLAGMLLNTGAAMLVEGNTWGDKFWGRVNENGKSVGLNVLGVILMEERGRWMDNSLDRTD